MYSCKETLTWKRLLQAVAVTYMVHGARIAHPHGGLLGRISTVMYFLRAINKQIATAPSKTAAGSKKGPRITHCACVEMTFRRSTKSLQREDLSCGVVATT